MHHLNGESLVRLLKRKLAVIAPVLVLLLLSFSLVMPFDVVNASSLKKSRFFVDEKAAVLQKIVDLQPLQSLYAKNADGSYKSLYVMQHGIIFPENIEVTHSSNSLVFIDKSQTKNGTIAGYFLFNQFEVKDGKAWVDGVYYYDQNTDIKKSEVFTIEFEKVNGIWTITKSQIERRDI